MALINPGRLASRHIVCVNPGYVAVLWLEALFCYFVRSAWRVPGRMTERIGL